MPLSNISGNIEQKNLNAPNDNNPGYLEQLVKYVFQLFENFKVFAKRLFIAEILDIGANYDGYKPKIVMTGEKVDLSALQDLKQHTSHQVVHVKLDDLESKAKEFDPAKDILIIGVHKMPGDNPLRLFSGFDGPLSKYKETVMQFNNTAILVYKHPSETRSEEQLKEQLTKQLNGMKGACVDSSRARKVAETVKELFSQK